MKLLFTILITISPLFFLAQKKIKTFWDSENSQPKEIYFAKIKRGDTIKNGNYLIYHKNGNLWQKGNFENNQLTGKWIDNHYNGQLKQDLFFSNNFLEGEIKSYYPLGSLHQISNYKNDILHGKVIIYHENGNLMEETNYSHGLPSGICKGYFKAVNFIGSFFSCLAIIVFNARN